MKVTEKTLPLNCQSQEYDNEIHEQTKTINYFYQQFKIGKSDLPFLAICIGALIYFTFKETFFIATLGCFSILFLSLWHIARAVPILERFLGTKIRFWHVTTIILVLTIFLSQFQTPAHALFLSGLETLFEDIVSSSSSSIDPTAIDLVFNLIRGAFLILVAAAALFAFNQAQQGNDWRPIVTQVGLAFGIVVGIDVITFLFTT